MRVAERMPASTHLETIIIHGMLGLILKMLLFVSVMASEEFAVLYNKALRLISTDAIPFQAE